MYHKERVVAGDYEGGVGSGCDGECGRKKKDTPRVRTWSRKDSSGSGSESRCLKRKVKKCFPLSQNKIVNTVAYSGSTKITLEI